MKARKTNVSQTQKNPVKTVLIVLGVAAFFGLAVAGWMSGAPKTVGSYGGVEIPAGVYRLCQYQALSAADDTKDTEAIEAAVLENLQYYAAVESRFAALGEELTREEKKEAEHYAAEMWQYYGGLYGSYGIDQKTLEAYQYNYYKTLHLLAADNAGLTEAELNDYAQNKMVYGHYVTVPLYSSETYETADEDTVDAMLAAGEAAVKAYGEKRMLSSQAGAEAELADFTAVLKEQLPAVYAPLGEEYDPSALENELGADLFGLEEMESSFGEETAKTLQALNNGEAACVKYSSYAMMLFMRADPLEASTPDELRTAVLIDWKSEELAENLEKTGDALENALDAEAIAKYYPLSDFTG